MKIRRIVTIVLSIFVASSVIYLIATEVRKPAKSETVATDASRGTDQIAQDSTMPMKDHTLTVYYFHTTFRCPTCKKIEALTESTVKNSFSAELTAKKITWRPINIELPENMHFTDDFKLFTKSVVVVDSENGRQIRWKNLNRIWELVRDESAFTDYIKNEITGYLKTI
jgi:hypothetical protein